MHKIFLGLIFSFAYLSTPFAATPAENEYRCHEGDRGTWLIREVNSVGVGVEANSPTSLETNRDIIFCTGATKDTCFMTHYIAGEPKPGATITSSSQYGKYLYATLLTAYTTGSKVRFYCNSDGWAENLRVIRN